MLINLKPLIKYKDYRLLFFGQTVSFLGSMVSYVAVPYQIYQLTHSTFYVGLLGVVQLVPVVIFGLLGGSVADRIDRKKLLIVSEAVMSVVTLLLALNSELEHPNVPVIFILVFILQAANAYHRPAMEAMTQKMVQPQDYASVGALGSLRYSTGAIIGPALGGALLSFGGTIAAYIFDFVTFVFAMISVWLISLDYKAENQTEKKSIQQDIKEGLKFAIKNPVLLGTYFVDIAAMIFAFPLALYPALSENWGGAKVLGWLYAGMAMGSLVTTIFSGKANLILYRGKMVILAATLWGLAIVGFGFSHSFLWAMIFLALAGGTDMMSGLYRGIIWNETIPNNMRGRMAGIEMISYMSGPLLGNFRAGTLASYTSLEFSIVSGGVICIIAVVICSLLLPQFWKYKANVTDVPK